MICVLRSVRACFTYQCPMGVKRILNCMHVSIGHNIMELFLGVEKIKKLRKKTFMLRFDSVYAYILLPI